MRIIYADKMISDFEKIRNDYNASNDLNKLEKSLKKEYLTVVLLFMATDGKIRNLK